MARALYAEPPSAEEAAFYGLTVEEASDHMRAEVWPDNLHAVNAFIGMSTQWRTSVSGGYVGLDYSPLESVMRLVGVPKQERADVFDGVRTMEDAALAMLRRKKR